MKIEKINLFLTEILCALMGQIDFFAATSIENTMQASVHSLSFSEGLRNSIAALGQGWADK